MNNDKALKIIEQTINCAAGIMQALKDVPTYSGGRNTRYGRYIRGKQSFKFATAAICIAISSASIAMIASSPRPRYEKGCYP